MKKIVGKSRSKIEDRKIEGKSNIKIKSNSKSNSKININGGGQECPPYNW